MVLTSGDKLRIIGTHDGARFPCALARLWGSVSIRIALSPPLISPRWSLTYTETAPHEKAVFPVTEDISSNQNI